MIGGRYADPQLYVDYYKHQAGNGLSGYYGSPVMYGSGIGGLFKSLFRMAVPILKRGMTIAKPHLKTAAKGIVSDVVSNVVKTKLQKQDGEGLAAFAYKNVRRPPGLRNTRVNKKRKPFVKKVILKKNNRKRNKRSPSLSLKRRKINIF